MAMRTRDASLSELMDGQTLGDSDLRRNLADLRRINALLGWTALTTRAVARHIRAQGLRSFSLLDVACGSADIPVAIARWAVRAGINADIVATDLQPAMLVAAQEVAAATPSVRIERADALALPYAAGSFDVALCTLALHHFAPDDAVTLLTGLARAGRHVLVFDVARSRLAYAGAVLLTHTLRMSYVTRHDAPMSVRRGYSTTELRELAAQAGLRAADVRERVPFRLALSAPGCFDEDKELPR
jgi:2-polyprenyl-3-methyl-5-hydroxy-6-metoxy-1,4-benzoquinol methylase